MDELTTSSLSLFDGTRQEGLVFEIKKPDGGDWDGDGAAPLDEERSEASRVKATAEDRVPALALDRGFRNWRTIWDFAGNAKLKKLRQNPNVLWDGDEVAFPKKFQRAAKVVGGGAEYVVNQKQEKIIWIRPVDFELQPMEGIRYQSDLGDPEINQGVIPPDGYIALQIPCDVQTGSVSLFLSEDEDAPPLEWQFEIQKDPLDPSTEGQARRLINLGLATRLPPPNRTTESHQAALASYRANAARPPDEDGAEHLVGLHDGNDSPEGEDS